MTTWLSEENWLNAVYYALSPTSEVLVFGHGSKMIALSNRWDNATQQYKYGITWSGHLENPNDIITSIICLPVLGFSGNGSQVRSTILVIAHNTHGLLFRVHPNGRVSQLAYLPASFNSIPILDSNYSLSNGTTKWFKESKRKVERKSQRKFMLFISHVCALCRERKCFRHCGL